MIREPLTRSQVKAAVERTGDGRLPVIFHKWWGNGLAEAYGERLTQLAAQYPDDICTVWYLEPGYDLSPNANPAYRLGYKDYTTAERHSIGNDAVLLPDWNELDRFLQDFPDPNEPGNFLPVEQALAGGDDRYRVGCWWRLFHERLWTIRGMENLMYDYYDEMENLKRVGERILDYSKVIVDRYAAYGCDAIFSSDDLGHQKGPMMSPDIFRELYLPLYKELISHVHSKGMRMFLHSCGDNSMLMESLIEAGLDVFHPVQKGCMDMEETARRFGDRITFMAGVDVQGLLPNGTPQEVRQEIARMKQIFLRRDGGLLLAMGNGIMPGTPLENIEAALTAICQQ